jgi:hypothetical protein
MIRRLLLLSAIVLAPLLARAEYDDEPKVSTAPIGSPFFRHLANDFSLDIHDVALFEKKGFGRAETVTIVLISSVTGNSLKSYGRRRLKERVPLEQLAREAGLDYPTLLRVATIIKQGIESKGENNLPPPVFAAPPSGKKDDKSAEPLDGDEKDKKNMKKEGK